MLWSVVEVTPSGLLSSRYTERGLELATSFCPYTSTSSPSRTMSPRTATRPLIRAAPASMARSASRRLQSPWLLMYLLRRVPDSMLLRKYFGMQAKESARPFGPALP